MPSLNPDPADPLPPEGFRRLTLDLSPGPTRLVKGGNGPPLVLVHGLGGCSADFFASAPRLAKRFTCLIPDLPGYGASAKPDATYTPYYFTNYLEEMSRSLGLVSVYWAGHSMGGMLVVTMACRHPELVSRAAGICPAGGHNRVGPLRKALTTIFAKDNDGLRLRAPCLLRLAVKSQFSDRSHPFVPALQERAVAQYLGPERAQRERALVRSAAGLLANPLYPLLSTLRRPVKLITGLEDWVVPAEETDRLLLHIPPKYLELPEIMDCGHLIPFERAGAMALVLESFFQP